MTRIARLMTVAVVATAVAAVPAVADAKTVNYKGKTAGGHTITFKRAGKKVWWISTMIPTICLPTNRVGQKPISGAEIFTPPGYEIVNRKVTFEDLQKPAMYYSDVTKHYEVSLKKGKKGKKGKLTGKLHLTFSFIIPTYPMPAMIIYMCAGDTTLSASPR